MGLIRPSFYFFMVGMFYLGNYLVWCFELIALVPICLFWFVNLISDLWIGDVCPLVNSTLYKELRITNQTICESGNYAIRRFRAFVLYKPKFVYDIRSFHAFVYPNRSLSKEMTCGSLTAFSSFKFIIYLRVEKSSQKIFFTVISVLVSTFENIIKCSSYLVLNDVLKFCLLEYLWTFRRKKPGPNFYSKLTKHCIVSTLAFSRLDIFIRARK